jgi:crotonobetainyl-CoA:carnitine CoA-transferase CaiB-like acyl-CoA transferase
MLGDADTCVTPVHSVVETVDDPQFTSRRSVTSAMHPTAGPLRQLSPLLAGMDRPGTTVQLPDMSQTQTASLLRAAGVDGATVDGWIDRRAVA